MAKCPLAKNIMLASAGSLSYTTPPTVGKLKGRHDRFLEAVEQAIREVLDSKVVGWFKPPVEKSCLAVYVGGNLYSICGKPDALYVLYGGELKSLLAVIIEATLSPSVWHLARGELLFYCLATYLYYGCGAVGLVVNPRHVYLVLFGENAIKSFRRLFGSRTNYEKTMEQAEEIRAKHPWVCSLCDLKHVCPLGAEV